jgi:SM-20-related protein
VRATAEDLASLGLFARKEFLAAPLCRTLVEEVSRGVTTPGKVLRRGSTRVDESTRSVRRAVYSSGALDEVAKQVEGLRSALSAHFRLEIEDVQPIQLLRYRRGDFFKPHADDSDDPESPECVRRRKISLIIFLNDYSARATDGTYSGGELAFYRLSDNPTWSNCRTRFVGETGLLLAFRSHIYHEVSPVTGGERLTLVSWLTGRLEGG